MIDDKPRPDIDYLTRDYAGFRQLMLDLLERSSTPWRQRSAADLGVQLVEALANQLDHVSYAADRVAMESFLSTARRRASVRRHAALGGYTLDRGCLSQGLQHFHVAEGMSGILPAGTQVSPTSSQSSSFDPRLVFETSEDTPVDARWNVFALSRSLSEGSLVLPLRGTAGEPLDLRELDLRPGMPLVIRCADYSEQCLIKNVVGGAAMLEAPLQHAYLSGDSEAQARVYGNLVPIRRGQRTGWTVLGRGGATSADLPADVFLERRLAVVRGLRDEAEAVREAWLEDDTLSIQWTVALSLIDSVVATLRVTSASALSDDDTKLLDADIQEAATLLRTLLTEVGQQIPFALKPSEYVTVPNQTLTLEDELVPLWQDGVTTLEIQVGVVGRWQRWTEVPDFLRSAPDSPHYLVDIANRGTLTLTFGDGRLGAALPVGGQVIARWIAGEPTLGNVGADALKVVLNAPTNLLEPSTPTWNPMPTTLFRPPEPLERVPGRHRLRLSTPAVPVTSSDYQRMVMEREDVLEAVALPLPAPPSLSNTVAIGARRNALEVVIRQAPGFAPTTVLNRVRDWLGTVRLAGAAVNVRLYRPVHASVSVLLKVSSEAHQNEVCQAVRQAIRRLFNEPSRTRLGVAIQRAEIYQVVERVSGVAWSQVLRFGMANQPESTVLEVLPIEPDQVIDCLDRLDSPLEGQIALKRAREYELVVELSYSDPDFLPSEDEAYRRIMGLCSGPSSPIAREGWSEVTVGALNDMFKRKVPAGEYAYQAIFLTEDQKRVGAIRLTPQEVAVVGELRLVTVRSKSG